MVELKLLRPNTGSVLQLRITFKGETHEDVQYHLANTQMPESDVMIGQWILSAVQQWYPDWVPQTLRVYRPRGVAKRRRRKQKE